jgi:hypothetical protein
MAGLKAKEEYGELATAVSLGITLHKKTKKNSWSELIEAMCTDESALVKVFKAVELTDEQPGLISVHQNVLGWPAAHSPPVVLAICPSCGLLRSDGGHSPVQMPGDKHERRHAATIPEPARSSRLRQADQRRRHLARAPRRDRAPERPLGVPP